MQFSGVCCWSLTLLSSNQVSAPFTPLLSRLVQMSCTHPHANLRLRSCPFLHMFTCATPASLSQCILGRDGRAAKAASGSRQRIEYHYDCRRESKNSRGCCGAQDASVGAALEPTSLCMRLPNARSRMVGSALERKLGARVSARVGTA